MTTTSGRPGSASRRSSRHPSPRRGFVDNQTYDHTSILRFIEWRFLGAPPEGPAAPNGRWYLTERDRQAKNIGASLVRQPDPALDIDLDVPIAEPSAVCDQPERPSAPDELSPADVPQTANFREKVNAHFPPAQASTVAVTASTRP